jgi:hypothetical protein
MQKSVAMEANFQSTDRAVARCRKLRMVFQKDLDSAVHTPDLQELGSPLVPVGT